MSSCSQPRPRASRTDPGTAVPHHSQPGGDHGNARSGQAELLGRRASVVRGMSDRSTVRAHSSSGSPSALSDAAGNFALALDDRQEIASDTVRFVAFSPTGEVIGEAEITTTDLGDAITIDVEYLANAPLAPGTPTATPERTAVDAMFRGETAFRAALTDNLKPLRAESAAIAKRIDTPSSRSIRRRSRPRSAPRAATSSAALTPARCSNASSPTARTPSGPPAQGARSRFGAAPSSRA